MQLLLHAAECKSSRTSSTPASSYDLKDFYPTSEHLAATVIRERYQQNHPPERTAHVKRLLLGLFAALVLALAGVALPASAAPNTPTHGPGRGAGGQVTAINGTTITVKPPQGTATLRIATTANTTFVVNGAAGSLSGITVGMFVHAEGTKGTDGVLTATRVSASTTRPERPARPSSAG
jgi:hypothetical protein